MSIKQMSAVWERACTDDPSTLLVMLALADWANDDGVCWPAMASIAEKCRISERTAQRIVKQLERCELLEVSRKHGRNHTNVFRLKVPTRQVLFDVTPVKGDIDDMEKVTPEAEKVTNTTVKGDTAMSPEPSGTVIEPPVNHSARKARGTSDSRFKAFTDILHRYWQKFAKETIPFEVWFGKAGGKQLNNLLAKHEALTPALFERFVANRARSPNMNHALPVYEWIGHIADFAAGPKGAVNGTSKAQQRERERDRKWQGLIAQRGTPDALPAGSGNGLRPRLESGANRPVAGAAEHGTKILPPGNH